VSRSKRVRSKRVFASSPRRKARLSQRAVGGERVGSKKRDMRWKAPDGEIWASRFEYEVYCGFVSSGLAVRRARSPQDSFSYDDPVRSARCVECGGGRVVKTRKYTPDLFVRTAPSGVAAREAEGYYVEAKGFIRPGSRRVLRSFRAARPDVDLRIVVQRDYKVTRSMTLTQWIARYLKCPVITRT
jgi:hypothetical protein